MAAGKLSRVNRQYKTKYRVRKTASCDTRVLTRLVLKYTLRAAHLELGWAKQEVRCDGKP